MQKKRHSCFQLKTRNKVLFTLVCSPFIHWRLECNFTNVRCLTNLKYADVHFYYIFSSRLNKPETNWRDFCQSDQNLFLEDSTCSLSCLYSVRWQLKHVCDAPPCCRSSVKPSACIHSGSKCLKLAENKFTCIGLRNFLKVR